MSATATYEGTVSVTANVCPRVLDVCGDSAAKAIEARIGSLLRRCGLALEVIVTMEVTDASPRPVGMRVSVGGLACHFPDYVLPEVVAYVTGTPRVDGVVSLDAAIDVFETQPESGPAEVAELLALICEHTVARELGEIFADHPLSPLLSLGMSVRDRDPSMDAADASMVERAIADSAGDTIDIVIDPGYLRTLSQSAEGWDGFPSARDGLFVELGIQLPSFHLDFDDDLRPGGFAFRFNAIQTLPRIGLAPGTILVNATPEQIQSAGVEAQATVHPGTHLPAAIAAQAHAAALERAGITTWDPLGYLVLCLAAAVRVHAYALMTRDMAAAMLGELGKAYPSLGTWAEDDGFPDVLAGVLRDLLADEISVRNMRRIAELVLRYRTTPEDVTSPDLISFVRSGLADQISFKLSRQTDTVVAYLIDPEMERALDAGVSSHQPFDVDEQLVSAVREELAHLPPTAQKPVILTQPCLRRAVLHALRAELPFLRIVTYDEIPPEYNVQPIARILRPEPAGLHTGG